MRIIKSSWKRKLHLATKGCVRYVNGSDVTAEDVKEANVIIGNVDPALVKRRKIWNCSS